MKIPTNKHYLSRDPHIDWVFIVVGTCLLTIGLVFFDYSIYQTTISGVNDASIQSAVAKLPFEQSALDEAVALQVKHKINRTSIVSDPVIVGDPSR
ncbi:MAG: hypothetical protein WCP09_00330 [Candidatus Taylorbacteria bacterium]